MKPIYMRGVQLSAKVSKSTRQVNGDFLLYSAMSHKSLPVATIGPNDKVECRHIPPFWAVMLVGRDTSKMVNMLPYLEEYKCPHAVAEMYGEVKTGSAMTLKLPFLTNKCDLAPGDLLVMPFDGGLSEIFYAAFPPIQKLEASAIRSVSDVSVGDVDPSDL